MTVSSAAGLSNADMTKVSVRLRAVFFHNTSNNKHVSANLWKEKKTLTFALHGFIWHDCHVANLLEFVDSESNVRHRLPSQTARSNPYRNSKM